MSKVEFTAEEIISAARCEVVAKGNAELFTDVVTDTRKIEKGNLFIALKGERFNGEDFVQAAVEKGASGVLVGSDCPNEKLEGIADSYVLRASTDALTAYGEIAGSYRDRFHMPMISITGSNGKTTTKDMTASVLGAKWDVLKTQANFNNEVGIPQTLMRLRPEHEAAVVEIGMRGLHQIEALAKVVKPSIGIVTNVGETHMELLGSIENIAKAKAELVEAIQPGGTVILNADNPYVAAMDKKANDGVRVVTFGIENDAEVRGSEIRTQGQLTYFTVSFNGENPAEFELPMVGIHNVYNALAAIAAGYVLGESVSDMQKGLAELQMTGMRFEYKDVKGYHVINDAYNASPMSMKAALNTLKDIAKGRTVAVLGDMLELGDVAVEAHRQVGREAAGTGVFALITRGPLGESIADGAIEAGMDAQSVSRCSSHEEAGQVLHEILQPGDTVLFKGSRGMQMEKIIDLL